MSKHIEKLKKQLLDISEVVNSFRSEAVQVKVIERLLDAIIESDKADTDGHEVFTKRGRKQRSDFDDKDFSSGPGSRKPGATKILNQLLSTDFFNTSHSISSIAEYCKEHFDSDFKTSELSGILLKLANENKLKGKEATRTIALNT